MFILSSKTPVFSQQIKVIIMLNVKHEQMNLTMIFNNGHVDIQRDT